MGSKQDSIEYFYLRSLHAFNNSEQAKIQTQLSVRKSKSRFHAFSSCPARESSEIGPDPQRPAVLFGFTRPRVTTNHRYLLNPGIVTSSV